MQPHCVLLFLALVSLASCEDATRWSRPDAMRRSSSEWVPLSIPCPSCHHVEQTAAASGQVASLVAADDVSGLLTPPREPQAARQIQFQQPPTFLPNKPFHERPISQRLVQQPPTNHFLQQQETEFPTNFQQFQQHIQQSPGPHFLQQQPLHQDFSLQQNPNVHLLEQNVNTQHAVSLPQIPQPLFHPQQANIQQLLGQENVNNVNQLQDNSQYQQFLSQLLQSQLPETQVLSAKQNVSEASSSNEEKPDVQLVYVPVETLRQRGRFNQGSASQQQFTVLQNKAQPQLQEVNKPAGGNLQYQEIRNQQRSTAAPSSSVSYQEIRTQAQTTPATIQTTPAPSKPIPHQPPLSVYMGKEGHQVNIADVIKVLKSAKTIAVLDSIGPDSPQVFVGPSNLKPPLSYAKFELPYLSSIDTNRVERKVEQLPFFVAPLNFKPPTGYSKIPFPAPHIGSVVISNSPENPSVVEEVATKPTRGRLLQPHRIPTDVIETNSENPALANAQHDSRHHGNVFLTPASQRPTQQTHQFRAPTHQIQQEQFVAQDQLPQQQVRFPQHESQLNQEHVLPQINQQTRFQHFPQVEHEQLLPQFQQDTRFQQEQHSVQQEHKLPQFHQENRFHQFPQNQQEQHLKIQREQHLFEQRFPQTHSANQGQHLTEQVLPQAHHDIRFQQEQQLPQAQNVQQGQHLIQQELPQSQQGQRFHQFKQEEHVTQVPQTFKQSSRFPQPNSQFNPTLQHTETPQFVHQNSQFSPSSPVTPASHSQTPFFETTQSPQEELPVVQEVPSQPQEEENVEPELEVETLRSVPISPKRVSRPRPRTTETPVEEVSTTTTRRPFTRGRRPLTRHRVTESETATTEHTTRSSFRGQNDNRFQSTHTSDQGNGQRINPPRTRVRNSHRVVTHRVPTFQKQNAEIETTRDEQIPLRTVQQTQYQQEEYVLTTQQPRQQEQDFSQQQNTERSGFDEQTTEEIQFQHVDNQFRQPAAENQFHQAAGDTNISYDQKLALQFQNALSNSPTRNPLINYEATEISTGVSGHPAVFSPVPSTTTEAEFEPYSPEPPKYSSVNRPRVNEQSRQPQFQVPIQVAVQRHPETTPATEETPRPVYVRVRGQTRGRTRPPPPSTTERQVPQYQVPAANAAIPAEEPEEDYGFIRPVSFPPSAAQSESIAEEIVSEEPSTSTTQKPRHNFVSRTSGRRPVKTNTFETSTVSTTAHTVRPNRRPVPIRPQTRLTSVRGRVRGRTTSTTEQSDGDYSSTVAPVVRRRPISRYTPAAVANDANSDNSANTPRSSLQQYESPSRGSASFRRPAHSNGQADSSTSSTFQITLEDEPENYPPGYNSQRGQDLSSQNSDNLPSFILQSNDPERGAESQWPSKNIPYKSDIETSTTPFVYFTTEFPAPLSTSTETPEIVLEEEKKVEEETEVETTTAQVETSQGEVDEVTTAYPLVDDIVTVIPENEVKEVKSEVKKAGDYNEKKVNPVRRGSWVRVRKVKRPVDSLETAESQNFGAKSKTQQLSKGTKNTPLTDSWSIPLPSVALEETVFDVPKIVPGETYSTVDESVNGEQAEFFDKKNQEDEIFKEITTEPNVVTETSEELTTVAPTSAPEVGSKEAEIVKEVIEEVVQEVVQAVQEVTTEIPSTEETTTRFQQEIKYEVQEQENDNKTLVNSETKVNKKVASPKAEHLLIQSSVQDAIQQNTQEEATESELFQAIDEFFNNPETTEVQNPEKSVRVSESTEVSHETEICYRGRCIKTKTADNDHLADETESTN